VRLDARSLDTVLSALDRLADPLARALCWSVLWDMARDAELPARRYVAAVERFAAAETDPGVLQVLLDNARFAVEHYCPADARSELREGLLASVRRELDRAEPGSDAQLTWARALASLARRSGSSAGFLSGLLDGSAEVPGLVLDPDLRWRCWQALAATGSAGPDQLDAELAGDRTASGRAGHLAAMAARPDPEVKARTWQDAVAGSELSNQLLDAAIDGFQAGTPQLLEPYIEPYFQSLEQVWAGKSIELAGRIARGLYPRGQDLPDGVDPADHPVVVRTDQWLQAQPQAPAALRRIVVEQRDHLVRALTAQSR
jgi:aminopeptidase N